MVKYNFESHILWSLAIIWFRATEQTTSPAESNWHVVWQRCLKPDQNKSAPKNKSSKVKTQTGNTAICRKWDRTWRNGFWTHATLKPLADISLSKYRRDLQVQKHQSLKMIKVQFSSVLFSCFAGRQIITEKKRSMKLSNEKTNKFDRGQNMIMTSLKIGHVLNSLNLVLPALSAVLPLCFLSSSYNQFLFVLIEPVCCNSAARHKQKEIYIIHLLSVAHFLSSAGEQTGLCAKGDFYYRCHFSHCISCLLPRHMMCTISSVAFCANVFSHQKSSVQSLRILLLTIQSTDAGANFAASDMWLQKYSVWVTVAPHYLYCFHVMTCR